jgi:hypothetical protein
MDADEIANVVSQTINLLSKLRDGESVSPEGSLVVIKRFEQAWESMCRSLASGEITGNVLNPTEGLRSIPILRDALERLSSMPGRNPEISLLAQECLRDLQRHSPPEIDWSVLDRGTRRLV